MSARPFLRRGPSGPLAQQPGGLVQEGYDEVEGDPFDVPGSPGAIMPRNSAGDPLRVVLPDVEPGNVLEVDIRLNVMRLINDYGVAFDLTVVALVTFDGSAPAFPGASTFLIANTSASKTTPAIAFGDAQKFSLSALGNCPIPDGATTATVEVLYIGSSYTVSGLNITDPPIGLGATLKASEYMADVVSQAGPGALVAT